MLTDSVGPARRRQAALILLGIAVAASATLLLVIGSRLTFFYDDWEFLIYRRGFDVSAFLDPHNEHIVLIPVAIYKALLASFGMTSSMPFRVVSTIVFLISAVLLFIYLRRRVGDALALLATVLVLFLGPAWEDLLWPFQVGFFGSVAAGLGMLLMLERDDRTGDRIACLLLTVSIAFSSLGLAFAAGAVVDQLLSKRRSLGRLYVVAVPLVLFAVWWLGWGRTAPSYLSLHNVVTSPDYVLTAISYGVESLAGLTRFASASSRNVLRALGLAIVCGTAAMAWWTHRRRRVRIPRELWIVLAIAAAFWILGAFNVNPARGPTASRYQYPSAIFVLLIAAELARGAHPGGGRLLGAAAITAAALVSNLYSLHDAYSGLFLPTSNIVRADQAAIEIARDRVDPKLVLSESTVGTPYYGVAAGPYLSAVREFGSPAYSSSELAGGPEYAREAADRVLAAALGIALVRTDPAAGAGGRCRIVTPSSDGATGLRIRRGTLSLRNLGSAGGGVLLARFADTYPVGVGFLSPGTRASMAIPADRSSRPWRLGLIGAGRFSVCREGSS